MALKHYSHYRNSDAATQMWEVVSPALFEVYLTFPNMQKDTMLLLVLTKHLSN